MYLLHVEFNQFMSDWTSFDKTFKTEKECRQELSSIPKNKIRSWSIHPLFVQAPICSSSNDVSYDFTVTVDYGNNNKRPKIIHNVTPGTVDDVVFKDLDLRDVYKIIFRVFHYES